MGVFYLSNDHFVKCVECKKNSVSLYNNPPQKWNGGSLCKSCVSEMEVCPDCAKYYNFLESGAFCPEHDPNH